MKAIIENKLYDTSTATIIYAGGSDALYRTKNNAYFRNSSGEIIPMTEEEAKEWLGMVDADTYIQEFGKVEEA